MSRIISVTKSAWAADKKRGLTRTEHVHTKMGLPTANECNDILDGMEKWQRSEVTSATRLLANTCLLHNTINEKTGDVVIIATRQEIMDRAAENKETQERLKNAIDTIHSMVFDSDDYILSVEKEMAKEGQRLARDTKARNKACNFLRKMNYYNGKDDCNYYGKDDCTYCCPASSSDNKPTGVLFTAMDQFHAQQQNNLLLKESSAGMMAKRRRGGVRSKSLLFPAKSM